MGLRLNEVRAPNTIAKLRPQAEGLARTGRAAARSWVHSALQGAKSAGPDHTQPASISDAMPQDLQVRSTSRATVPFTSRGGPNKAQQMQFARASEISVGTHKASCACEG